jgi:hypothetical protein
MVTIGWERKSNKPYTIRRRWSLQAAHVRGSLQPHTDLAMSLGRQSMPDKSRMRVRDNAEDWLVGV